MGQVRGIGPAGGAGIQPQGRVGLVLGAGGVVGAAWMTGALQAVQDRLPMPINDVDLIVGTSAGSVLAAALRCGVTLDDMIALQHGDEVRWLREAGVSDLDQRAVLDALDAVYRNVTAVAGGLGEADLMRPTRSGREPLTDADRHALGPAAARFPLFA